MSGQRSENQAHAPSRRGWCGTCQAEVVVDGRPIVEDGSEWSHMRLEDGIGMDHDPGCWGDCHKHGCPVPVRIQEQVECGPVALR